MIRHLLRRITTDVTAIQRRNAALVDEVADLRAELDRVTTDRDQYRDDTARALDRAAEMEMDNIRLRALAGRLDATPAELRALEAVRQATEFGGLSRNAYDHPEHLTALVRKGLIEAQKTGRTYVYTVKEPA